MCMNWQKIFVNRTDLQLKPTLCGGQSFRWKNIKTDQWIGVFKNLVWIIIQHDNCILYKCFGRSKTFDIGNKKYIEIKDNKKVGSSSDYLEKLLINYLRLDVDLENYYKLWSKADPYFTKMASKFCGIRLLNQEVIENIFSFICSSNNNIKRITSMVEKLCQYYGDFIAEYENEKFYSFPSIENLAQSSVEANLRKAGFGYRAKFIYQTACMIQELGGSFWLENLKLLHYSDAKKELMKLPGVGAKIADCVCLMSLGHLRAIPVDTHIFKVASTVYLPHLKKYKNLNDKIYNEIGNHFRLVHGEYAGWANTVLFCSDLKLFHSDNMKKENLDDYVAN